MGLRSAYLGDGAYIEDQGFYFEIYATDEITRMNQVWIERSSVPELIKFLQHKETQNEDHR